MCFGACGHGGNKRFCRCVVVRISGICIVVIAIVVIAIMVGVRALVVPMLIRMRISMLEVFFHLVC
jgi:hypothetical protein